MNGEDKAKLTKAQNKFLDEFYDSNEMRLEHAIRTLKIHGIE